jgi:hypothetical protein
MLGYVISELRKEFRGDDDRTTSFLRKGSGR